MWLPSVSWADLACLLLCCVVDHTGVPLAVHHKAVHQCCTSTCCGGASRLRLARTWSRIRELHGQSTCSLRCSHISSCFIQYALYSAQGHLHPLYPWPWMGTKQHVLGAHAWCPSPACCMHADPATGTITTLASGHDFYISPRPSPDSTQLAFVAWDFPNMPW